MGKTRSLVTAAFLAAVLVASKFALDGLPNIELVSLLVILYTLEYPRLAVPAVYTYVFVYGLLNGFGIWWFPQLYIWAVLMLFARLMRQNRSVLLWALLSGLFGLCYGALYAVSYAVMNGGIAAGVAWWVTGIPFDLLHGAGNFVVALLLYKPLRYCLQRTKQLGPQAYTVLYKKQTELSAPSAFCSFRQSFRETSIFSRYSRGSIPATRLNTFVK